MSKLLTDIAKMLSARDDVELLSNTPTITGVQIKRIWRHHVYNPDSMSPHETYRWSYHGQAFLIEDPEWKKLPEGGRELSKRQSDLALRLGRVGCLVVFPETMDAVMELFGPVPRDIDEYHRRQQHKTVPPSRQPNAMFPGGQ